MLVDRTFRTGFVPWLCRKLAVGILSLLGQKPGACPQLLHIVQPQVQCRGSFLFQEFGRARTRYFVRFCEAAACSLQQLVCLGEHARDHARNPFVPLGRKMVDAADS